VAAVQEFVDLERYPIEDLSTPAAQALLEQARQQLAELGAVELNGFIHAAGVAELVADAEDLAVRAHRSEGVGTAYLELPDDAWPATHPRQHWMPYAVRAVGYDLIPYASPLRRIYEDQAVLRFIEAIVGRGTLYPYADPFGALNLAVMGEGDELQWHFDQTDFVVSLAIQDADLGGDFDVVPKIRTADDEAYDRVGRLLDGDESEVLTLEMTPGTLLIFEGRNSIHRVSPIAGNTLRHVGLLAYDTVPDRVGSALLREIRYGRTEPFAEPPASWSAT